MSSEEAVPLPDLDIKQLRRLMGDVITFSQTGDSEVELKHRISQIIEDFDMPTTENAEILKQLKKLNTNMEAMKVDMKAMRVDMEAMQATLIRRTSLQHHKNQKGGKTILLVPLQNGRIPQLEPFNGDTAYASDVKSMTDPQLDAALKVYGINSVPEKERLNYFLQLLGYPVELDEENEDEDE